MLPFYQWMKNHVLKLGFIHSQKKTVCNHDPSKQFFLINEKHSQNTLVTFFFFFWQALYVFSVFLVDFRINRKKIETKKYYLFIYFNNNKNTKL